MRQMTAKAPILCLQVAFVLLPGLTGCRTGSSVDHRAAYPETRDSWWTVAGRVTDERGRPVEGAVVVAKCGSPRQRETGRGTPDAEGIYTVTFGQIGLHSGLVQHGHVEASKPGLRAVSSRPLVLTKVMAPIGTPWDALLEGVVFRDRAFRADFTMAPDPAPAKGSTGAGSLPPLFEGIERMVEEDVIRGTQAYRAGRLGEAMQHYRSAYSLLTVAEQDGRAVAREMERVRIAVRNLRFDALQQALTAIREENWENQPQ